MEDTGVGNKYQAWEEFALESQATANGFMLQAHMSYFDGSLLRVLGESGVDGRTAVRLLFQEPN